MPLPPLTAQRMSSLAPRLNLPDRLSAPPVSVSSSHLNWRSRAATVKWPQSPLVSQRAVMSGETLSPLLKRAPELRYGVTVVCSVTSATDLGPSGLRP